MDGRIAWLGILAGLSGCARPNPAYGDVQTSATSSGSASDGRGGTVGMTRASTTQETAATSDSSAGPGSWTLSTNTSSMGPGSGPESDGLTSETATDTAGGLSSLLWISAPVMGDWDSVDDDPCGAALPQTGALCLNSSLVIAGRAETSIIELPELFDFLGGPFYAATTGELILESLDQLASGAVETRFVEALTAPEPAAELYVWRGPLDGDGALHCQEWSNSQGTGSVFLFEAVSGAVSIAGSAPCMSQVRLLCACATTL